ncbi:hypothetical protein M9458_008690, partial [Cirrhinus mrigala]
KRPKLSALEELFAVEDMAVEARMQTTVSSTTERIQPEINKYRLLQVLSKSSNLVVGHEGHSANAFRIGIK